MLLCLFGPTALFALIGAKSMNALAKRPSNSAKVMVALLVKIIAAAVVIMGMLMGLLKIFAEKKVS